MPTVQASARTTIQGGQVTRQEAQAEAGRRFGREAWCYSGAEEFVIYGDSGTEKPMGWGKSWEEAFKHADARSSR